MLRYLLIAEDHPICASALTMAAQAKDSAIVVEVRDTLAAADESLSERAYDALLLDLSLKDSQGLINLTQMRARHPKIPILVVSGNEEEHLPGLVKSRGGQGFMPKSASLSLLGDAIEKVMGGGTHFDLTDTADADTDDRQDDPLSTLSAAQLRVMRHLVQGSPSKIIAYDLNLAEATVKSHLSAIYRALGVNSRTQAILKLKDMNKGVILG